MSGYLLDTNVVSELRKRRPDPNVQAFAATLDAEETYLSVVTIAEIAAGAHKLRARDEARGEALITWLNSLVNAYGRRVLPLDDLMAATAGILQAVGGPRPINDTYILATAMTEELTLVTRNTKDFTLADDVREYMRKGWPDGVTVINPWEDR